MGQQAGMKFACLYLPLPLRDMPWVDVSGLEGGEQQLDRRGIVRVRAGVEHGDSETFH